MKNREKFFVIFAIVIVILTIGYIVRSNIEINRIEVELQELNNEIGTDGSIKDKYSDWFEEGIQRYMLEDGASYEERRFTAVSLYFAEVFKEYVSEYNSFYQPAVMIFNLIYYSIIITMFIYLMLTIQYKNIKQYLLVNSIIILSSVILIFVGGLLETNFLDAGSLFYEYYIEDIIPILYLIFLTGNAINNKKKLLLFNAIFIDLMIILDIIYNIIVWQFDISWSLIFWIYLPFILLQGIIMLIGKYIKARKTNEK